MQSKYSMVIPHHVWEIASILRHRIRDYHFDHREIENIFVVVMAYEYVVAEIICCRGRILPQYEQYLKEFEQWINLKSLSRLNIVEQYVDQLNLNDPSDLYLVYSFSKVDGQMFDPWEIELDNLIALGKQVDSIIVDRAVSRIIGWNI